MSYPDNVKLASCPITSGTTRVIIFKHSKLLLSTFLGKLIYVEKFYPIVLFLYNYLQHNTRKNIAQICFNVDLQH
jgi:hypothetical protein